MKTRIQATLAHISSALVCCACILTGCQKDGSLSEEDDSTHYGLPVIFHILYNDFTDPEQYIPPARLEELVASVNRRFKGSAISKDMNLDFVLTQEDWQGNMMKTPGVEYIWWEGSYPIDCSDFMSDNSGSYTSLLWDPNRFINIMVYNFAPTDDDSITLGISHLPFSTEGSTFLEGLTATEYTWLDKENLKFPYCVSINSLYIYHESTSSVYDQTDAGVTLAHELGHYLGLLHVFMDDGRTEGDSDYCEDTQCYSFPDYMKTVTSLYNSGNASFSSLVKRKSLNGTSFVSRNIMDYGCSYSDQFTADQKRRVRHVLRYSPLIPGPKASQTKSAEVPDGPVELPVRTTYTKLHKTTKR